MRRRVKEESNSIEGSGRAAGRGAKQPRSSCSCGRILCGALLLVLLLLAGVAAFVVHRMGFGTPFPVQDAFEAAAPLVPEDRLEVVAELEVPPGNLAVSADGRVFFNFHPEHTPPLHDSVRIKIAVLTGKTAWRPFPNASFQAQIVSCLSMRIDAQERLWLLDFAHHGSVATPRLLAFQLGPAGQEDQAVYDFYFDRGVAGFGSMLNDFQVDAAGEYIYIADPSVVGGAPGLVVHSVRERRSWRVLSGHPSMRGASHTFSIAHLRDFPGLGSVGFNVGVDLIALSRDGETLFYGAVTSNALYSVPVRDLHEGRVASPTLVSDKKPITDGGSTDVQGNVWLTAQAQSAIAAAVPEQGGGFRIVKVAQSEALFRWTDGLSFGPGGLYATCSAIHLKMSGGLQGKGPFHILRISEGDLKAAMGEGWELPPAGH